MILHTKTSDISSYSKQTFTHIRHSFFRGQHVVFLSGFLHCSLSAVGGHRNKPNDPSAVSTDDRPDVELYGPVFSQRQAGSDRTLFYKNPVNVKYNELEPKEGRRIPAVVVKNTYYDVD